MPESQLEILLILQVTTALYTMHRAGRSKGQLWRYIVEFINIFWEFYSASTRRDGRRETFLVSLQKLWSTLTLATQFNLQFPFAFTFAINYNWSQSSQFLHFIFNRISIARAAKNPRFPCSFYFRHEKKTWSCENERDFRRCVECVIAKTRLDTRLTYALRLNIRRYADRRDYFGLRDPRTNTFIRTINWDELISTWFEETQK